jgi:glutathione S-transferase
MPEPDYRCARFITIPLSHYCEKARWGLDRAALPYREETHAPLFSRVAGGTVPVLVHGNDRFTDSTDILVHADKNCGGDVLYPRDAAQRSEVEAFEKKFDSELGPHTRRWAYAQILSRTRLLRSLWSRDVPWLEGHIIKLIAPLTRPLVRRAYKISPESAQRSLERVQGLFQEIGDRLRDGRAFLVGERFTAADLTFAALATPVVFPVECRAVQPTLDEVPAEMREVILRMRDTDAGRFVLRMFAQER